MLSSARNQTHIWSYKTLRRLSCVSLTILVFLGAHDAIADKIYKWVDAEGTVHFSGSKPLDTEAERVKVNTSKTGTAPGAAALDKLKQEVDDEQDKIKEEGIPAQPPVPSLSSKEVNQRCKNAREDLATIQARGQLRERDEKGNISYVSEEEKQKRIKFAKQQIREYCH